MPDDSQLFNSTGKIALVEEELFSSLTWFVSFRWLAGFGILVGAWFTAAVLRMTVPVLPLYLIGGGVLVYNAICQVALTRLQRQEPRESGRFALLTHLQIGLDYATTTALIHFTGGLESPALLYFFFHIVIAAILLSPQAAYLYTLLAILLVGGVTGLEYTGLIPHVHLDEFLGVEVYRSPLYILGILFFFASAALVVAYFAVTLNTRMRHRAAQVVDLSVHLQRAYTRLQLLYDGAQAVNSTLELREVLDRLTRGTAQAMGVRACSIRLLSEDKTRLTVAAAHGLSEAYVEKGDLILEQNPLARQVLAGGVIAIADITTDTRLQYPAQAIAEGIRSMLSVPLMGKQGPLGLIRAYSTEPNHFTPSDNAFLSAIATYGSLAIENAIAYQAFERLDQSKSRFVLTVTHELRSPVSVVRSLLRTLVAGYAGPLTDEQTDIVQRAQRRADFLQTLIDDLLDLAAGKNELQMGNEGVPVDLVEAVDRVVRRFELPAREKHVALEWQNECVDGPVTICATNEGVDSILNNLISNAIQYTPGGGKVVTTLRRGEKEVCLTVADTGVGIPKESLPHVFEEFYRAPNAKAIEKEGTGLGLAITQSLVTRFGGRVTAQSPAGQGTVFTVIFPLK
ncbi:MAG: sensor histidine kinase [Acidobacteriota bacterium]